MVNSPEHDEFGPLNDFSLPRDLTRVLRGLEEELSRLNPKGPLPYDDESRFKAMRDGDMDALAAAGLEEQIANLANFIQEELKEEKRRAQLREIGKIGARESLAVRQEGMTKRNAYWAEQAEKKHKRNSALSAWQIAEMIAESYVGGRAKPYNQRTVFDVIKKLGRFQNK